MRRAPFCILLIAVFAARLSADTAKILIVDPAETEAGELLAAQLKLAPDTAVTRVDITQLRRLPNIDANEVIWLNPEPTLYGSDVADQFKKVVADRNVGLLIVGLPNDDDGCEKLVEWLRPRDQFEIGPRMNPHLHGANWIWSDQGTKDNQHVSLRKTFTCPDRSGGGGRGGGVHAVLEVSGDNRVTTYLNGQLLGTNDAWKSPAAYDVTALLKRLNENELKFDAFNEDGPAGVIASLLITDGTGKQTFRLVTDQSWPDAKVIAAFGEGPWEDKLFANFAADRWPLLLDHETGVIRRNLTPRGKFVKVLGTDDLVDGITSGNTSVFSVELDKCTLGPRLLQVLANTALEHLHRPDIQVKALPQLATPAAVKPLDRETFFPITIQFSPIPHEGVADSSRLPDTPSERRRLIDNLIAHGCTLLQCPLPLPEKEVREVEDYAQSRGMGITYVFEHGLEGFNRKEPPKFDVYSDAYKQDLFKRLDQRLPVLERYKNLYNIFPMQDEPFREGTAAFDLSEEHQKSIRKYYEYPEPATTQPTSADDANWKWAGFADSQSHDFPVAWQVMYNELKRRYPNAIVSINHDSHNVFGGAVGQEGKLFLDDLHNWSDVYADLFSFDIYPYLMKDFRYGPNRTLMRPRMSQMHFAFAQMRTLQPPLGDPEKKVGFYVGTYNPEWYDLTKAGREQYWMSREMAYTAVAGGADYLIAGVNVPIDARHWEDLGEGLNVLQKASPAILHAPRKRASAAMLFPRYQCLTTQEEYWNVAMSFEMLQRAQGELDILPEFSTYANLDKHSWPLVALFDVKDIEAAVAFNIEDWMKKVGGVVLADCVPSAPKAEGVERHTMGDLFGVRDADTRRILWPVKMKPEVDSDSQRATRMPPATQPSDAVRGEAFGQQFDFPIVSPRPCTITDGEVLLKTAAGNPALIRKKTGNGRAYLLGFCLQDTAFEAWRRNDRKTLDQLTELLRAITNDANVQPAIRSSNGDIEGALRQSYDGNDAFIVAVAHEPADPRGATKITVRNLKPPTRAVEDVATGEQVSFKNISGDGDAIELDLTMPTGSTRLLHVVH